MTLLKNKHGSHHVDEDIYDDIEKIKDALRSATENAKGRAAEMLDESAEHLQEKASAAKESLKEYTSNKPLQSLGIALAAGFIVGYLLRRK